MKTTFNGTRLRRCWRALLAGPVESVRQVVDHGQPVTEVAERLGITTHGLYLWKRQLGKTDLALRVEQDQNEEVRRLKAELRRVTETRDIIKKSAAYFAGLAPPH